MPVEIPGPLVERANKAFVDRLLENPWAKTVGVVVAAMAGLGVFRVFVEEDLPTYIAWAQGLGPVLEPIALLFLQNVETILVFTSFLVVAAVAYKTGRETMRLESRVADANSETARLRNEVAELKGASVNSDLVSIAPLEPQVPKGASGSPEVRATGPQPNETDAAKAVLALLRDSIDAAHYDWSHGLESSATTARHAARTAVMEAEVIHDSVVRSAVVHYSDRLLATKSGWKQQHGPNDAAIALVDEAYEAARIVLGRFLRGEGENAGA